MSIGSESDEFRMITQYVSVTGNKQSETETALNELFGFEYLEATFVVIYYAGGDADFKPRTIDGDVMDYETFVNSSPIVISNNGYGKSVELYNDHAECFVKKDNVLKKNVKVAMRGPEGVSHFDLDSVEKVISWGEKVHPELDGLVFVISM